MRRAAVGNGTGTVRPLTISLPLAFVLAEWRLVNTGMKSNSAALLVFRFHADVINIPRR